LDDVAIVNVKFTTNIPVKMVAAAAPFGVCVVVLNGRNVPFELTIPNTPLVFDAA
jgi:hypothetical protein